MMRWAMLAGVCLVLSHVLERHGLDIVGFVAGHVWGEAAAAQDEGRKVIRQVAQWAPEVAYWVCGLCLLAGALFGRDRV
jgi:hypothetical protein